MSRGIFINTLNTYIGTALYEEYIGDKPEENEFLLFGTYYEKDSSDKPMYIKKMMKRSKPGLFRKYMLEKMDTFIYDMHSGRLDDLEFGIKALTKAPLESEKTVIVISSVLSWGQTPPKIVEDIPEPILDENGNPIEPLPEQPENPESNEEKKPTQPEEEKNKEENDDKNEEGAGEDNLEANKTVNSQINNSKSNINPNTENKENNQEELKKQQEAEILAKIPKKKYKRLGYSEEEYSSRIPIQAFEKIKEFEDKLLSMNFENLKIYIICAGIPYGGAETAFNYFFKSAWLQYPSKLPYINEGANMIPTVHIKDLARIVRMVAEKKPEQKYIFAIDQTKDKTMKNMISCISRGIGTGNTKSILKEDVELKNITFTAQDFFIDPSRTDKTKLTQCITDNELNWQLHLNIDVMLNNSKFIEEEWEWFCREGIPANFKKLLDEFCKLRKLKPIKIILNSSDKFQRCNYSEKLAKFFNIPVINYNTIMEKLNLDEDSLSEEERLMNEKYIFLKKRLNSIDPNNTNETNELLMDPTEIMFETLKHILKENVCTNRGYVLEGLPINMEEINMLYYKKEEILEEGENSEENQEKALEEENNEQEAQANSDSSLKKIKRKKYKTIFEKELLPESVISINQEDEKEVDNVFWEVECFFQENNIEILNLLLQSNPEEIFEMMRIYIERNGRPFNYFIDTENDIHEKRIAHLKNKVELSKLIMENKKKEEDMIKEKLEMEYWDKMSTRIEAIKKDKISIESFEGHSTRKFLLLNIMPILTKGLLEVCKINPIDPIDYLADYLFKNGTD